MKLIRKAISIILILAVCFSLLSTALASIAPITETPTTISTFETTLIERDGYQLSLYSEDLSNGDIRLFTIENGEIKSMHYINRTNSSITKSLYSNGILTNQTTTITPQKLPLDSPASPNDSYVGVYTPVGTVTYDHYVQGMVMCVSSIDWAYQTRTNTSSQYNMTGDYHDFMDLMSTVLSFLENMSSAIGYEVVTQIFANLGLAIDALDIVVPDYFVSCVRFTVTWFATVGNQTEEVVGSRCLITHHNYYQGQTEYDGDYYPTSAIDDHNSNLALSVYPYFFTGHDRVEINSWPT